LVSSICSGSSEQPADASKRRTRRKLDNRMDLFMSKLFG
jgi:hypothetical protein